MIEGAVPVASGKLKVFGAQSWVEVNQPIHKLRGAHSRVEGLYLVFLGLTY